MAVIASPSINWASPTTMPQSVSRQYPAADMYLVPFPRAYDAVPSPTIYGSLVPPPAVFDNFSGSVY